MRALSPHFRENAKNQCSTGEYFEYLNPKKADLPYVYDNFEWKHCEALGYDIADRKWWNGTELH